MENAIQPRGPWIRRTATVLTWCASLAGIGMFGYSMSQQTQVQKQMDVTMQTMSADIAATTPLVAQASKDLQPLAATTTALASIEQAQEQTVKHIQSMNQHLVTIRSSEAQVLTGMQGLTKATAGVSTQLDSVGRTEHGILNSSTQAAAHAKTESTAISDLATQTADITQQLHALNGRLAALRLLP